ncbi:MAG TPA: HAD family hydrolase [Oleiagrimonas sp.]|nr:HAD family hydrolase [Oleiagrimonas sp.]
MIELVGFDGDDTLWHSEGYYRHAAAEFEQIMAHWTDIDCEDVRRRLLAREQRHLDLYGYGAKNMTLAMVDTAIDITDGAITGADIGRILALGRRILEHPVELLPGIREAVAAVADRCDIVLITKGDLKHQEHKIELSGLGDLFRRIEIVSEKSPRSYARVLSEFDLEASRFAMVGNSMRSDIEPVVALGGFGIHMPYHVTWEHELHHGLQDEHPRVGVIDTPDQILPALDKLAG